jgi:hypothetical protein
VGYRPTAEPALNQSFLRPVFIFGKRCSGIPPPIPVLENNQEKGSSGLAVYSKGYLKAILKNIKSEKA